MLHVGLFNVVYWNLHTPPLIVLPSKSADKNTTPLSLSPTFVAAPQSAKFGQDAGFLSLIGQVQGNFFFQNLFIYLCLFIIFFCLCVC